MRWSHSARTVPLVEWIDDEAHGSWRLLVDGRIAAVVVHHKDGWRGFLNPEGQEVRNSPHPSLEAAQEATVAELGQ